MRWTESTGTSPLTTWPMPAKTWARLGLPQLNGCACLS
jgi:hypothetical protein